MGVDFRIWAEIWSEIEIGGVDFRIWVEIWSEIEIGGGRFQDLGGNWARLGVTWGSLWRMRRICWGLVGPKSGHVEKVFVSKAFLEGQGSREESGAGCKGTGRTAGRG